MSGLERLTLDCYLFPRFEMSQQAGASIFLSSLKYLSVTGTTFERAALMRHIFIPPSTSVELTFGSDSHNAEDLPSLLYALHQYAKTLKENSPYFKISVSTAITVFKLMVKSCTGDDVEEGCRGPQSSQPYMSLSVERFGSDPLPAFLDALGYEYIYTVSLVGFWKRPLVFAAFERCVNVEHLRAGRLRHSFLALNASSDANGAKHQLRIFPRFRDVWLFDLCVNPGDVFESAGATAAGAGPCQIVSDILAARKSILKNLYTWGSSSG